MPLDETRKNRKSERHPFREKANDFRLGKNIKKGAQEIQSGEGRIKHLLRNKENRLPPLCCK